MDLRCRLLGSLDNTSIESRNSDPWGFGRLELQLGRQDLFFQALSDSFYL